jgi:hypothetical protein
MDQNLELKMLLVVDCILVHEKSFSRKTASISGLLFEVSRMRTIPLLVSTQKEKQPPSTSGLNHLFFQLRILYAKRKANFQTQSPAFTLKGQHCTNLSVNSSCIMDTFPP